MTGNEVKNCTNGLRLLPHMMDGFLMFQRRWLGDYESEAMVGPAFTYAAAPLVPTPACVFVRLGLASFVPHL